MISKTLSKFRRISRILWVRVALITALSLLAALLTPLFDPLIPEGSKERFSEQATLPIVTILANSMLAVTTFSLGIMVSTHRSTAQQTTPRIHRLLLDDTRTQSVLATFIGAFVYALASIILFRAGYYTQSASVVVFFLTVLVVGVVVLSIVRWIDHLSKLGSMDYALSRAEESASETLATLRQYPALGAYALKDIPHNAETIEAPISGYLKHIDFEGLNAFADQQEATVYVEILPGDTVLSSQTLAKACGAKDPAEFARFFILSDHRVHEQDARYAIQSLRETASKALSPGINDPGTAIEVTVRLERLLWDWMHAAPDDTDILYPRVFLSRLHTGTLLETAFIPIARDGAAFVDVLSAVHRALRTLSQLCSDDARATAERLLREVEGYAEIGLHTDFERKQFHKLSTELSA